MRMIRRTDRQMKTQGGQPSLKFQGPCVLQLPVYSAGLQDILSFLSDALPFITTCNDTPKTRALKKIFYEATETLYANYLIYYDIL